MSDKRPSAATHQPATTPIHEPLKHSLQIKFILALGLLSFIPFLFVVLHLLSGFGALLDHILSSIGDSSITAKAAQELETLKTTAIVLAVVTLALVAAGTVFAERLFIGQIRTLRDSRGSLHHRFLPTTSLASLVSR